ncbi:MAG: excinuclease ABC subunit UvrC, partial [Patescibacteria group bacterium]
MIENGLKTKITSLPSTPGIYIYKNAKGDVLYVGKAKNLRSRVRSYFTKSAELGPLKEKLITLIADFGTISTDTELEALVLEATLIHKHQPPYNVLLRDDKYYLFIKITKEEPPRIFPVRKITQDGSRYFGPYSSAFSVRATLRLLQRIFPFKGEKDTAHDIIFPHTLFPHISPPHMRGSTQPELGRGSGEEITHVIRFLKGNRREIMRTLEQGIADASKNLEFERAALFRDQLQAVQRLEGSQKVYLPRKESFDVISIAENSNQSAANVLQIREGKLIGKQTFLLKHKREGAQADILRQFLLQYYAVAQDVPKQILLPMQLEDTSVLEQWIGKSGSVKIVTPERGVRKALI